MSNIYLKVLKTFSKFQFSGFKKLVTRSVFWELQLMQISLNFKTCCNLKIRGIGAKLYVGFLLFSFWKVLWHFKVKDSMHFVKRNYKLWWVEACERKKMTFFEPFILSKGNLLKIFVLFQCIMYWIHFHNVHTFRYQETLIHTLLLLAVKIIKSFQCILKQKT